MEGDENLCLEPVPVRVLTAYPVEKCRIRSGQKTGLELAARPWLQKGVTGAQVVFKDGATNTTTQGV